MEFRIILPLNSGLLELEREVNMMLPLCYTSFCFVSDSARLDMPAMVTHVDRIQIWMVSLTKNCPIVMKYIAKR